MYFTDFLQSRLKKHLPGFDAHIQMAPVLDNKPYRDFTPSPDARPSAVLVLICGTSDEYKLLFTLRSSKLTFHSGQISFPGERIDGYETPEQAAFREASEEVALKPDGVYILGKLSNLFVPPSNSYIIPIVAYSEKIPDVRVNSPNEVDEVFFVPLSRFIEDSYFKREIWDYKEREMTVPLWKVHPTTPLWGATSMILKELTILYKEYLELARVVKTG